MNGQPLYTVNVRADADAEIAIATRADHDFIVLRKMLMNSLV